MNNRINPPPITLAENIKKNNGEIDSEDNEQLNAFLLNSEFYKDGLNYDRLMSLVSFIEKTRKQYEFSSNECMDPSSNGMDRR